MRAWTWVLFAALGLAGCGYSSVDNEAVGQPKRLHNQTPVICTPYTDVDVSLGVMRDGVGSMSTHDEVFLVPNEKDRLALEQAIQTGKLVKIRYNIWRVVWCVPEHTITSVEVL